MATRYADPLSEIELANMATATRFIEAFNNDDWDEVRQVVAPGFVFHHPLGGTVTAGPEGMVQTWAGFKQLSPDSWHPIPIMIAEDDYVAVLLPTYGTFTGRGEKAPPPTGGRLDYGMVNIVRIEDGQLVEIWFGMDPLVELQQMGVAPSPPPREVDPGERAMLDTFFRALGVVEGHYETITVADGVVIAMGPDQADRDTVKRLTEIYGFDSGVPRLLYRYELITRPPHPGHPSVAKEISRGTVKRWFDEVLTGHSREAVATLAAEHLIVHPTAMPCEAGFYGIAGVMRWLDQTWQAFGDLAVSEDFVVSHGEIVAVPWTARGTATGAFMGQPATGKPVEFTGVSMFRLEDGKIIEIWEARNTMGILHQLNPDLAGSGHH